MKFWKSNSLRVRMTWRIVVMQVVVLLSFAAIVAVPIVSFISNEQGIDDSVVEDIASSIHRTAAGSLGLVPTDGLKAAELKYPALWFYAVDAQGHTVQMGDVPEHVGRVLADLAPLDSANIEDLGSDQAPVATLRNYESDAGRLSIITATGPQMRLQFAFAMFGNPLFLGLILLFTLVSFIVLPIIVSRQLRGVDEVAAEADRIDVDQQGVRLSLVHVPEELHPLVRAVNSALQRLDDGMQRRQRFLADAAHELRTPIAILQTRIEALPDSDEQSELMLDVARLANLANQLLDLQRLDAEPILQHINLVELAAQVTSDMAPLVIAAGGEISFDAEIDTIIVAADPPSLSRAVVNLIQNAIIHGGVKTIIRVGVGRHGVLSVSDNGPGISEEYREAIFEPFSRIIPLDQGAGLGLSMVRDIALRHGAKVAIGDAIGGGALFEITIPVLIPN